MAVREKSAEKLQPPQLQARFPFAQKTKSHYCECMELAGTAAGFYYPLVVLSVVRSLSEAVEEELLNF